MSVVNYLLENLPMPLRVMVFSILMSATLGGVMSLIIWHEWPLFFMTGVGVCIGMGVMGSVVDMKD